MTIIIILQKKIVNERIPRSYAFLWDDCMQEIWLACAESFERILSFSDSSEQKLYVSGIMRNQAIDFFRKEIVKQSSYNYLESEINLDELVDYFAQLDYLIYEEGEAIFQALEKLPENMRLLIESRFGKEESIKTISTELGISEAAAYKRLERGLKELRQILTKEEGWLVKGR